MKKFFQKLLSLAILIPILSGCNSGTDSSSTTPQIIPVESVQLNETSKDLKLAETFELIPTVLPENATNKSVLWSVDPSGVVSVDNGLVTAIGNGTAVVKAEAHNSIYASCTFNVTTDAQSITLSEEHIVLSVGETKQLEATIHPETASDKTVIWSTENENIATVENGIITAVALGTTNIIVNTINNKTASCVVDVVIPVESVQLNETSKDLKLAETFELIPTVLPENATNKSVLWSVDPSGVVSVDNGLVTAIGNGTAVVKAEAHNSIYASCTFNVTTDAQSITLSEEHVELSSGSSKTLTVSFFPETTSDKSVVWSSSNEFIASVDSGTINAYNNGTAVITATTVNGLSKTCSVTVSTPAESVKFNRDVITINVGGSTYVAAEVLPVTSSPNTLTWTSSASDIVSVDNGAISGLKVGKATISAKTENNKIATLVVNVVSSSVSVHLDSRFIEGPIGKRGKLTATVLPTQSSTQLLWSSSDEDVVAIDQNGNYEIVGLGFGYCTVSGEGFYDCCYFSSYNAATSIRTTHSELNLAINETFVLTATLLPLDTTDVIYTWYSSDRTIATVENGSITAHNAGQCNVVVVSSNGLSSNCTINVVKNAVALQSIALSKTVEYLGTGSTTTIKCTFTPSNTTFKNVVWSSSDTSVATVNESGVVTAKKGGQVTIKCVGNNGVEDSITLTCFNHKASGTIKTGEYAKYVPPWIEYYIYASFYNANYSYDGTNVKITGYLKFSSSTSLGSSVSGSFSYSWYVTIRYSFSLIDETGYTVYSQGTKKANDSLEIKYTNTYFGANPSILESVSITFPYSNLNQNFTLSGEISFSTNNS